MQMMRGLLCWIPSLAHSRHLQHLSAFGSWVFSKRQTLGGEKASAAQSLPSDVADTPVNDRNTCIHSMSVELETQGNLWEVQTLERQRMGRNAWVAAVTLVVREHNKATRPSPWSRCQENLLQRVQYNHIRPAEKQKTLLPWTHSLCREGSLGRKS